MKRSKTSLTEGSIVKGLVSFTLPLLLGQIFQQLYNTADAIIVGNFMSDEAYAAVTSSGTLVFLLIGFFGGISVGAGVVIARYFGANDREKLRTAVHTTVAFSFAAGLILTVVGVTLTPQILKIMGTPDNVLLHSVEYFRMYFAGALAISMYNGLVGILRAVGDSKHPLYYLIFSSVVNVVLDLLFVGVFRWGVWSAAAATSISQSVSVVLCIVRLMRVKDDYRLIPRQVRFNGPMLGEVIRYGLPSGFQNSIIAIANVVVQSNINSFGSDTMAGCGTYSKLEGFAFLPITCFTMALTTFVGQNLGAKQYERAKKGAVFGTIICVVLAELIGVVLLLFPEPLFRLFTDNPAALEIGVRQAKVEALFFCMLAFSHCVAAVLRGAGRPMVPMFVMLGVWCILRVSYLTIMLRYIHEQWVIFTAYPLTWTVSSVIFLIFFLTSDWLHAFDRDERKRALKSQRNGDAR